MKSATEVDVRQLNSFLRGELSAVETYQQAIAKLLDEPVLRAELNECLLSHQRRVELLRAEIVRRGGEASEGSGAWGAFAKLVEAGANVFGRKAAIAALEEGEDHGRDEYREELAGLDSETRTFVESKLLPEQLRTHDKLSALKRAQA